MTRNDYLLITLLTIAYSIAALVNLGSLDAPETSWMTIENESVTVDFAKEERIRRIYHYGLYENLKIEIEASDDGRTWKRIHDDTITSIFKWSHIDCDFEGRFVRLGISRQGARIFEMGFFGDDNSRPVAIDSISGGRTKEGAAHAFDEQHRVRYNPSYLDEMYFDEIYHARTAWEHLHRLEPTESTHPPLGKIFISPGIALFGMNPFGWRIVGCIFGILMIPSMYIFGLAIFKSSKYAFFCAYLLAFDFMHFSQTRIATIDTYGVLFIILMYYFMYRYHELDLHKAGLRKTLVPLGLSGLFFGLGISSKWICLYAGGGLAVIFFITLVRRYVEYMKGCRLLKSGKRNLKEQERSHWGSVTKAFPGNLLKTLAWSFVFFVIIPGIIYLLSYIPFMMVPGPGHGLKDVITYQKHIYNYHKNLKATHPFASPWWSWPIMKTPLWLYEDVKAPQGRVSSIVSMGNPAVWWVGMAAVIVTLFFRRRGKDDHMTIALIAIAFQYVPWMLVPRLTFIYHFFSCVPFLIFCIVYCMRNLEEERPKFSPIIYIYLSIVFFLFLRFFPILSGMEIDKSYVLGYLKWFPTWYFCR